MFRLTFCHLQSWRGPHKDIQCAKTVTGYVWQHKRVNRGTRFAAFATVNVPIILLWAYTVVNNVSEKEIASMFRVCSFETLLTTHQRYTICGFRNCKCAHYPFVGLYCG